MADEFLIAVGRDQPISCNYVHLRKKFRFSEINVLLEHTDPSLPTTQAVMLSSRVKNQQALTFCID